LRYLLKHYAKGLQVTPLAICISSNDKLTTISGYAAYLPILPSDITVPFSAKTLRSRFALPGGPGYNDDSFLDSKSIRALAIVFAYLKNPEKPAKQRLDQNEKVIDISEIPEKLIKQFESYIKHGYPSPYQIVNSCMNFGTELMDYYPPAQYRDCRKLLRGQTEAAAYNYNVVSTATIKRDCYDELYQDITQRDTKLTVILGAAGEGKTILAKRLAIELKQKDYRVIYADSPPYNNSPFPNLPDLALAQPTVMFIDRSHLCSDYKNLENDLQKYVNLQVVLIARSYEWEVKDFKFSIFTPIKRELKRLSSKEAQLLANKIIEFEAADETKTDITRLTEDLQNKKHLLAAMIEATQGHAFSSIINNAISEIKRNSENWKFFRLLASSCVTLENGLKVGMKVQPQPISRRELKSFFGDKFDERYRACKSEAVVYRSPNNEQYFDFRHPDITYEVIRQCYEWDYEQGNVSGNHEINAQNELVDDLLDIMNIKIKVLMQKTHTRAFGQFHSWLPMVIICQTWVKFWENHTNESPIFIGEIYHFLITSLGSYEVERDIAVKIYTAWLSHFQSTKTINVGKYTHDSWNVEPPYSMRWIAKTAWEDGLKDPNFIVRWIGLEVDAENMGSQADQYSARGIAKIVWEDGLRETNFVVRWISLEIDAGNIGSHADQYSARGIAKIVWEEGLREANFVVRCIGLEVDAKNMGSHTDQYSARGIAKTAWEDGLRDPNFIARWISVEANAENIGTQADEFSARWIAKTAWEDGLRDPNFIVRWINLEFDAENIGSQADEFSARGVAKTAWEDGLRDPNFIVRWINLEIISGNIGTEPLDEGIPEFNALWLARQLANTKIYEFLCSSLRLDPKDCDNISAEVTKIASSYNLEAGPLVEHLILELDAKKS